VILVSNDVIRVSIEASEVSIIVCTIVPSNSATDVMAGWKFCAGILGENGVLKGERSTFSLSVSSILSCRVLTSVSFLSGNKSARRFDLLLAVLSYDIFSHSVPQEFLL